MHDPHKAASTYHVHGGVQLGTKAPDDGPVLNHVRGRRVNNQIKRVGKMGGWIERLAMAALSRAMCLQLLLCMRIALVGVAVRVPRSIYIRRLTLFNSIKLHLISSILTMQC